MEGHNGGREQLLQDEDGAARRVMGTTAPRTLFRGRTGPEVQGKRDSQSQVGSRPQACSAPLEPYLYCQFRDNRPVISVSSKVCIFITESSPAIVYSRAVVSPEGSP